LPAGVCEAYWVKVALISLRQEGADLFFDFILVLSFKF